MKDNPAAADDPGLSPEEAAQRLRSEGYNELPATERRNFLRILVEVMRQPMFMLLMAGGAVYLLLGDRVEAIMLLLFASLSVVITLVQESRSEKVLEALRNLASPRAMVVRGGRRFHVAGREVVRGDLIVIAEGDRIAADALLVEAQDLMLDESLLTGESVPVRKIASDTDPGASAAAGSADSGGADATLRPGGDGLPALFAGTLVVRGAGPGLPSWRRVVAASGVHGCSAALRPSSRTGITPSGPVSLTRIAAIGAARPSRKVSVCGSASTAPRVANAVRCGGRSRVVVTAAPSTAKPGVAGQLTLR
jgi:magnesium-transporting ATPase (P-type)